MDKLQSIGDEKVLREIRKDYEKQLEECCGIELKDFPEDISSILQDYSKYKSLLQFHDFSSSSLEEFYCQKQLEEIDQIDVQSNLENEINSLEKQLEEDCKLIEILEKFIEDTNEELNKQVDFEEKKQKLETGIKILQEKVRSDNMDAELNKIISKVQVLEFSKKSNK